MIEKPSEQRVFGALAREPTRRFGVRELARASGVTIPTVLLVVKAFKKSGYVKEEKVGNRREIRASMDQEFLDAKRVWNLRQVSESGLLGALREQNAKAVVLFGSYSRGGDTEGSDIDIAIIGGKEFEIGMFEKRLHRKISLHAMKSGIPKDLLTNLANGIVLDGYLEVA